MIKKFLLIFSLIFITACTSNTVKSINEKTTIQGPHIENYQKEVSSGITEIKQFFGETESGFVLIYKIDPKKYRFSLKNSSKKPKTISGWKKELVDPKIIINAAYFNEDFSPTGLVMIGGTEESTNIFDYKKSGMVTLTPNIDIIDTSAKGSFIEKNTTAAFQSFPFLIKNNISVIGKDSGKTSRRSFIGKDIEGNIYLGVIPEYFISLKETADYLINMNIQWDLVLNLDGGTSTGLIYSDDNTKTFNSYVSVPSIITVETK